MTSAIFDFADIHKRMLGPNKEQPECPKCEGGGWVETYSTRPPAFATCPHCFNPEGHPSP
jgi:hypothetical protein